jgi:hypothetical protein
MGLFHNICHGQVQTFLITFAAIIVFAISTPTACMLIKIKEAIQM